MICAGNDGWTVVLPTENAERMKATIASISAAQMGIVSAIIVTGDAATRAAALGLSLSVIDLPHGAGHAQALNLGLAAVETRYAIISSDTARLVTPFGFSELARVSEDMEDAGLLLPALAGHLPGRDIFRSGAIWETANIHPRDFMLAVGLLPMDVYGRVGAFDETFHEQSYSDIDYALRAHEAGVKSRIYQRVIANLVNIHAPMDGRTSPQDHARFIEKHRAEMLRYGIR